MEMSVIWTNSEPHCEWRRSSVNTWISDPTWDTRLLVQSDGGGDFGWVVHICLKDIGIRGESNSLSGAKIDSEEALCKYIMAMNIPMFERSEDGLEG
jgi:hypothetical protein